MRTLKINLTFIILLFGIFLFAQSNEDVVELRDGSIIRGEILEYEKGGQIKIKILGGSVLVYAFEEVVKMSKEQIERPKTETSSEPTIWNRPSFNRKKGVYNFSSIYFLPGRGDFNNPSLGIGMNYILGYQFTQHHAAGLGFALETIGLQGFSSVYIDYRGYLLDESFTPYYNLGVGIGFPTVNIDHISANNLKYTPGLYLNPAIGIRFASNRKSHFILEGGYRLQSYKASFNEFVWDPIPRTTVPREVIIDRIYHRLTIRLGILF